MRGPWIIALVICIAPPAARAEAPAASPLLAPARPPASSPRPPVNPHQRRISSAGAALFVGAYFFAMLAGAGYLGYGDRGPGYTNAPGGWMFLPLLGPWLAVSEERRNPIELSRTVSLAVWGTIGVIEWCGALLLAAGYDARAGGWTVLPYATEHGTGLALAGRFP